MSPQLRSELLKQRTTSTNLGLAGGMLGLIVLAVALHGFGLRADDLARRENQLMVLGRGEFIAALFAGLLGALSITGEYRQRNHPPDPARRARPRPRHARQGDRQRAARRGPRARRQRIGGRRRVDRAPHARDRRAPRSRRRGAPHDRGCGGRGRHGRRGCRAGRRHPQPGADDDRDLGLAAVRRGLLGGNLSEVGRFAPGAAGMAVSGQEPGTLLAPPVGLLVLALYAMIAVVAGIAMTTRRDVA